MGSAFTPHFPESHFPAVPMRPLSVSFGGVSVDESTDLGGGLWRTTDEKGMTSYWRVR